MGKLIETLEKQLADKGAEINGYIEKNNIQVRGGPPSAAAKTEESKDSDKKGSSGVLVN